MLMWSEESRQWRDQVAASTVEIRRDGGASYIVRWYLCYREANAGAANKWYKGTSPMAGLQRKLTRF